MGSVTSYPTPRSRGVQWTDQTGTALRRPDGMPQYVGDTGRVDARNYGIYGDGGDYTSQLQAAIDDLNSKQSASTGYRTLVLPPGALAVSSKIILKRCSIISESGPNSGTRVVWNGATGVTAFEASSTEFQDSFLRFEGINFRNGTGIPLHWFDFSTYTVGTPTTDVMFRLRELHFMSSTSHAIVGHQGGWINCHWEHLRFDQIGGGFAIFLTPAASLSASTFRLDGFTYDHSSNVGGWGVIGIDNSALASNVGTVELANGRIEINGVGWASRVTPGTLGSGRSIFQEYSGATGTSRAVGWKLRNVTYSDSSGMGDDSVVFRNTSASDSDNATTLLYDNVRAVNLAKVFAGKIAINGRLDMFRVGSLSGVGAINPLSSNGMEGLAFGNASTLTTDTTSPNGVRASSRGSIATVEGTMAQGMFVKEISDTASTGWARVETSYIQSISYASSITPWHNNGNVAVVGTLTGNMTVNTMAASGTYVAGLKMRFLFTSDGSARTVSWNATWKGATLTTASAANQKAIVEFQYDGASWVQTFSTGWYS